MTDSSSTSSSSPEAPAGPWGRTWLAAVILAAAALGAWEGFWRARGFAPALQDDAGLWSAQRERARGAGAVILCGSSRIQTDMDLGEFAKLTGTTPAQIAIGATTPLPVMEDLAADPEVRGLVICDVTPAVVYDAAHDHESLALAYLRYFRDASPSARAELALRRLCQRGLACRLPDLAPRELAHRVARRLGPPVPSSIRMTPMRAVIADYGRAAPGQLAKLQKFVGAMHVRMTPELPALLERFAAAARTIEDRGGRVVFVRLPSSGEFRALEAREFPRERTWNELARRSGRAALHFEDHPSLAGFTCPDGSHLDIRDAAPFTRAFVEALRTVLSERGDPRLPRKGP